ncbi:MAG: hypothetical protein R3331_09330 [Sulfurospirillaceae bacterium]|nr:hypothetical protein [Sulfurospirillaceae bacterium]
MQVITYVNGLLTVINGDNFYKELATKPSFITGTNFYFEPTLKQMDGIDLTAQEESDAIAFINSFVFTTASTAPVKKQVYCIDNDGNYIGYFVNDGNYQEADSAPTKKTEKWTSGVWVDSVLVDKTTGKYNGIGDTRTAPNTKYAPNIIPKDFDINYYSWDGTSWNITLTDAKTCKSEEIRLGQKATLDGILGEVAVWEPASYDKQEQEARAWNVDNTIATPFIDALLASRNLGETKQQLVDKIIQKADAYASAYASMLGKFQDIIKQIQNATTVDAVKAIVWS